MNNVLEIFVIDDDPVHRLLVEKVFARQQKPYHIVFFKNGLEAITRLREIKDAASKGIPDVILLDIEMPVMNGWKFMDAYAELSPALRKKMHIYMVSSSFSDSDQQRAHEYEDIKSYIVKPLRVEHLEAILP